MSLGIVFKSPEGVVLAADSRVTITYAIPGRLPATTYYDDAAKVLRVAGQTYVGAVTVGAGAIGGATPRTAASFIPEFEKELGDNQQRMSVSDFATKLGAFFLGQWNAAIGGGAAVPSEPMVFLVAGYNESEPYARVYQLSIPTLPTPTEVLTNDFGVIREGQTSITQRIMNGFDSALLTGLQVNFKIDEAAFKAFLPQVRGNCSPQ